jgi:hypothetical protein
MEDSLLVGAGWAWVGCDREGVGENSVGMGPQEQNRLVSNAARQNTGLLLKLRLIRIPIISVSYNLPSGEWIDIILEN